MPTPTQADKIYTFTQSVANWTSGAGDPNLTNIDSKRGYVYQDWTNGQLYIFGESQGLDQWLRVLRDESSGGGGNGDGTIFTNYQGYNIWARSVDAGSGVIFDWETNRGLKVYSGDGSNTASADFDQRLLYNNGGTAVADWSTYVLASVSDGNVTLNWDQKNLLSENIPTVDWATQVLRETAYSQVSLDWYNFKLYDQDTAIVSANWNLRQLYDSSAGLSVDWQARQLRADATTITADWFSRLLYGAWTTSETSKTSGNVMSMANYAPTTTSGTYNPTAPANAGMSIYHVASTNALIAAMTLALHGTSSAIDAVPIGAVMSFTSRYGVTALTVTYGSYTVLGTAVATIAAGATIQWRKVGATTVARIS